MAYFEDLTEFVYDSDTARPGTLNIGWLDDAHSFEKEVPGSDVLDKLWSYCRIAIGQTRGLYRCTICNFGLENLERNGVTLHLGSAEIRVFAQDGRIYASPNLVYHYVLDHGYKAPDAFVEALMTSPGPPSPEYFENLRRLRIEWGKTPSPVSGKKRIDEDIILSSATEENQGSFSTSAIFEAFRQEFLTIDKFDLDYDNFDHSPTPPLMLEGQFLKGVVVYCVIADSRIRMLMSDVASAIQYACANDAIPKLKEIVKRFHPTVKFKDENGRGKEIQIFSNQEAY